MNTTETDVIMANSSSVAESIPKELRASFRSVNVGFHQLFNFYLMGVILVIGVIANTIIVIVMREASFRKLPISVYFTALAISDTVVLCFIAGLQIMKQASGINYFTSTRLCSTCGFLSNFATGTSSWFVVCVAFERVLVVKYPLKTKTFTSKTKAVVTLTAVTIILFLMNSHYIYMVDFSTTNCEFLPVFKPYDTLPAMIFGIGMNLVPLGVTCLCYLTLVTMVTRNKAVAPTSHSVMKEKVTITSLYICQAFLILTSPVAIYIVLLRQNGFPLEANKTHFDV